MKTTGDVCGRDAAHDVRIGTDAIRAKDSPTSLLRSMEEATASHVGASGACQNRRHYLYRREELSEPQVLVLLVLIVVEVDCRHEDRRKAEGFDEWGNRDSAAERSQLNRRPAIERRQAGDDAFDLGITR